MGSTVDLDPILALAREHGLRVIEDTAQAHGADHRGRRVGTIGDIGCFSFYPTKNLGGWGDGGGGVTDDADLAEHNRLLRSHGEKPRYHHRMVGTTARLDALQAALLRVKLARLDDRNADRRRLGAALRAGLEGTSVELPAPAFEGADHVYHLFIVRSGQRDALRAHLEQHGVSSAVHYPFPIHRTEAYGSQPMGSLPAAERLSEQILTLPLFPTMSDDEVARVIDAVASFDSEE
jgi:dTDP-4-amino-4,6-dideoxygalactose transaminase